MAAILDFLGFFGFFWGGGGRGGRRPPAGPKGPRGPEGPPALRRSEKEGGRRPPEPSRILKGASYVSKYVHTCVTNFTNRYKTANNGRILDFKVSIEAYGHSASNYCFRIFKFGLVWRPSWIFGQFWSILQTCIKRLIIDTLKS